MRKYLIRFKRLDHYKIGINKATYLNKKTQEIEITTGTFTGGENSKSLNFFSLMSKGEKNSKTNLVSIFGIDNRSNLQLEYKIGVRGRKSICFKNMFPSMTKGEIVGIIDNVLSLMAT